MRLNTKEQEYVISQLMQKNYDNRQGYSSFKSKTIRSTFTDSKSMQNNPPPGLYEPKFNNGKSPTNSGPQSNTNKSNKLAS